MARLPGESSGRRSPSRAPPPREEASFRPRRAHRAGDHRGILAEPPVDPARPDATVFVDDHIDHVGHIHPRTLHPVGANDMYDRITRDGKWQLEVSPGGLLAPVDQC